MRTLPPLGWRSHRTTIVGVAVALVCVGLAVPRVVNAVQGAAGDEGATAATAVSAAAAPLGVLATPRQAAEAGGPGSDAPSPGEDRATPTGGDDPGPANDTPAAPGTTARSGPPPGQMAISMTLRWPEYETGERILAKLRFANGTAAALFLPAPAEPNAGLAIVVEDESGGEVRRVVESGRGGELPRRMVKLAPGGEFEMPFVVLAEDETPLAPGRYSARVELRADPLLARLGLPVWSAATPVRSEAVPLVVTAKKTP